MVAKTYGLQVWSAFSASVMFLVGAASASSGVWQSTAVGSNGFWTNSLNWSAAPYPSGFDAAWFTSDGNGQTALDLAGLPLIKFVTFDTPAVGAFTFGTGAANSQTLVLADSGEIKLSSTAGNSQTFNGGVQLGIDRSAQTYSLRNDNPAQTLTFNDLFFVGQEIGGSLGNKTLAVNGAGPVSILGSMRRDSISTFYLYHNNSSTLTLGGSNVVTALYLYGGPSSVLDIGSQELVLNNNGGNVLNCYLGGTITGTGKLRLSTWDGYSSVGYNYADLNVVAGKTLTVNCEITGYGGLESNSGTGTFVLNGINTFLGHMNFATAGGTFSVSSIGDRGVAGNCGMGTNLYFANTGRLLYTGAGENTDRPIVMNSNPTIEQAGSGTLRFTAQPTLLSGSRTMILQGATAGIGEFAAPLSNTGSYTLSILKYGSGTWTFSGTNTYTGSTTVHGGKLLVSGFGSISNSAVFVNSGATLAGSGKLAGSSAVTVASGGVLAPGDLGTVGTLTLASTLNMTNAVLCYDLVSADAVGVATDKVAVAGALTLNGTNTVVLSFPNGTAPAGTYTLLTFASKSGPGIFQLAAPYANATLTSDATSLKLTVVGSSFASKWKGAVSSSWDGSDANWVTNGVDEGAYTPGDAVSFDDTATQFTVASSAPVAPAATVFNNSANDYTVSAVMDGTGTVYKLGTGLVTLTGANTYTGVTEIMNGKLKLGGAGSLGGGVYATNLINNGEFIYASSAAQTNSGVISGGGTLTQAGSGLLTLSGNNTYVGMTVVTSGVLRVQHPNALGSTAMGTVVAVNGTLDLSGTNTLAAEFIDLSGTLSTSSGSNTISGIVYAQHGAIFSAAANATLVINYSIPDTGSNTITKTGPGLMRFTADPNPKGMFIIDEGTVELQHSGSTDVNFIINPNGTLRQITANDLGDNYTIQANGILDLRGSDGIGGFSGIGLVTNSGSSAITMTVGNSAQSGEFSGVIRNGAGSATVALSKTSSGYLTLSGASTYSGGTTVSGGQLNINNGGSTSAESAIGTGTLTISGTCVIDNTSGADVTLLPTLSQSWNGDFTFLGSKSLNLGSGNVSFGGNRTINVSNNTLTVGGTISGSYSLTKNGAGTFVMNGANSYSGSTTVNGGALIVNGSTASGSAVTVNGGTLGGSGTVNGTANLVTGSVLSPGAPGAVGTLTFANSGNALTLNGNALMFDLSAVAGTCDKALLSSGSGKLVFNGTNTVALTFPTNGAPAGAYTLMTFPGGYTAGSGALIKLLTPYPNATLTLNATSLVLTLSATTTPGVAWTGAASGSWDGGALNWTADGATSIAYPAGAGVTFDDTAAGNFTVSGAAPASPATVLFNNSANDYTVSAPISGSAPLTKQGSAGVILTGTSDYNPDAMFIADGPLAFAGASQLNSGSYAGAIAVNSSLTFAGANPQVLSGTISGGGILALYGNGMLTLAGSNFYSGTTIVNSGTLRVTHPYGLGSTLSGTVVNPGATLELAGNIATLSEAVTLNGLLSNQTGSNTLGGTLTLYTGSSVDVGAGSTLVLKGFQANGPFTKTGAGLMKLTSDPNGYGVMTVQDGTVEITSGTMDASVVVKNGATLIATPVNVFNDTSTRLQLDEGSTYVLRQWDQVGGLAGAGTITQDTPVQAWLCIGNNGFSETFSGSMQNGFGVLGLTKIGTGIQTLTGVSTYTGPTLVGVGTLLVNAPGSLAGTDVTVSNNATFGGNGSVGGSVTVLPGGALAPGDTGAIGTLAVGGSLSLSGNTLLIDLPASGTVCDSVAVTGALALEGVNTLVVSCPAGAAQQGDYTLMTFASRSGAGSFAALASYPNATLELTDTSLVLHVGSGGLSGLVWNGGLSSQWDGGILNWKAGGADASFASGSAVLFDDSASQYSVGSAGNVAPSAVTFNNSINPYYIAAPITGTAPLIKSGTALSVLNKATAYNPSAVIINGGTLMLASAAQLNGGTYAGNIVNNGNFNHYSTANQTLSGAISGNGSLSKTSSGTLTLIDANAYLGGTSMSSGTLIGRGSPTVFGFGTLTFSGGTIDLQNDVGLAYTNAVTLGGSVTMKAGRVSAGPGVGHAMGALSIGNYTFTLSVGANVNNNTPYGIAFGTTTLSAATPTFTVNNNGTGFGTLTLGSLVNNYNITKSGGGILFLPVAANTGRNSASTTLNGGVLKLGHPGSLGTSGTTLTLTAGTLDLAADSSVFAYNTTVNGNNVTCQCDRATANAAGITHTLGTLSLGAYTFFVTNGPNVLAASPYGLTFGATTFSGSPTFDVAENGTLTLGAIGGNYTLTKRNHGTLKLSGVNSYNGATTVNQGKLVGVTGGSSANSAITLQSTLSANAVAKLGVLCSTANGQWTCSSLTLAAPTAPATTNPALEFAFSVPPSGTVAPLKVTGAATFTAAPSDLSVFVGSLSVTNGVYPLMTVGSAASKPVPTLTVYGGYSGSTLGWVGNTLFLTLNGSPSPIAWATGAAGSGVWDVNNAGNLVWQDSAATATSYQEPAGTTGSSVLFDDSLISADTAITLNSIVTPTAAAFSNDLYRYTFSGSGGIAGGIGLTKQGANVLTFGTVNSYTGSTAVASGTLKLASGGVIYHPVSDAIVGKTTSANALLHIGDGAVFSNRWLMVGQTNGSVGAVYNQGTLGLAGSTSISNFALGFASGSYGYYRHDTPVPLTIPETGIGGAYNGEGVMDVMQGTITNSTYFQINRAYSGYQCAALNVLGGTFVMPNSTANAHLFYGSGTYGTGVINVANGGLLGSAGTSTELDLIKASTSASTFVALNLLAGGTVQATQIKVSQSAGQALVNFNGGTLRANYYKGYRLLGNGYVDRATVFEGGATIDTAGCVASITLALQAPSGKGVTAIPVTSAGTGYIGRPIVSIIGGGGVGATALAEFDPESGEVTAVTITSPGYNYTSAPTIAFIGGGGTPPTLGTVTIGTVASGGLTKVGAGTLTLSGANTYTGATVISNGTLQVGAASALPTNSPIVIAGGTLDLNGYTLTNASINLISGSIVNGKLFAPTLQGADSGVIHAQIVSTNGLEKAGAGTLIIGSAITSAGDTVIDGGTVRLSGRKPGLYEGRLSGSFDLTTAGPKTATPLSTRYANQYFIDSASSGGIWPDNSTYVYSGYLWNDAPTNETWTFFRCFDDSTRLMLNGTNVLLNTNMSGISVISNATVLSGWNTFELRLGQGAGSVGNNNASFPDMGIGFDRKGRNWLTYGFFQTLSDPGDGSLLTLTNVFDLANANILPTNSALAIASGALLDLGGTGQKLGGLSGSGTVSNGTLNVNGIIAPGGLMATGTLTLASSSVTLSGALHIDVADNGQCDVVAVQGDLAMNGLALVVDNPGALDPAKSYTIMTCTGARSGTFSAKSVASGWVVVYAPNGDVKLQYKGGTLIRLL